MLLGVVGVVVCTAAVGLGWWVAIRTVDRVDRAATRFDEGLAAADAGLARVESRMAVVRGEIDDVRTAAEKIAADDLEWPRVRAAIEQQLRDGSKGSRRGRPLVPELPLSPGRSGTPGHPLDAAQFDHRGTRLG